MRLAARWQHREGATDTSWATWEMEPVALGPGGPEIIRMGVGEPIVLVPGMAGGWQLVAPLAQRLVRRGFEVILCGLRGEEVLGSPTRRIDRIADLSADLGQVIDGLRLERPIVMGVSFGGAVALEWAVDHPERVGGLILQGVESRFRPNLGSTITRRVLERYPLPSDSRFLNQFFNILHGCKPEPSPLVDFVVERCWETDQGVVAQRLRALELFDVTARLDRIEAPTLVVAGSRDAIVPPARQKAMADAIAHAQFVPLDGAGHIGFLTHGEELARQVARFRSERYQMAG